jgi:ATP-dependent Zn protease
MTVRQNHLKSAADQIVPKLDQKILRRVAVHEAGHVVAMLHLGWLLPKRVCLTAQGGQVEHMPFHMLTPKTARERLHILLAGRAAEICIFGDPSSGAGSGAESDLAQATNLALAIERQWGFGESGLTWDSVTAHEIWRLPQKERRRVELHLQEASSSALALVTENKAQVVDLAKHLLRVREMSTRDIRTFAKHIAGERTVDKAS